MFYRVRASLEESTIVIYSINPNHWNHVQSTAQPFFAYQDSTIYSLNMALCSAVHEQLYQRTPATAAK